MNILITGSGRSGSFQIRGVQLGKAIGATVLANAIDIAPFDLVVVVKRTPTDLIERIRRADVPLVWDIVDNWPQQGGGNDWSEADALAWLKAQLQWIRPTAVVAATQAMAGDVERLGVRAIALPHHAMPGIERNPIREHVRTVGYIGGPQYMRRWGDVVARECARRGWVWDTDPLSITDLDIVVGLRDQAGYPPRRWKSAVKMSNAQGSGTPFIGSPEAGYLEQSCGVERFVDTPAQLARALDALEPVAERRRCAEWMLAAAPRLPDVAARYAAWLGGLHA